MTFVNVTKKRSVDIHKCNHSRLANQSDMAVKICLISHANTVIKDGFNACAASAAVG